MDCFLTEVRTDPELEGAQKITFYLKRIRRKDEQPNGHLFGLYSKRYNFSNIQYIV